MNNSGYKQSEEELQQHLIDTLNALELSVNAYDKGYEGEAKRLAASIRVLVHDTNSSHSLLGQLGKKTMSFYDTCIPQQPSNIVSYQGLTAINMTPQGAKYIAPLDDLPLDITPGQVDFETWWNEVVFKDKIGNETTRKDLILAVANKDGGAHVDPTLDEKYADLSRRNSLAWRFHSSMGDVPLPGPEKAAIRQIAHEVLKTLNPTMPKMKPKMEGSVLMDVQVSGEKKQARVPIHKVGRNELCPCGSGKKYKRCHGK